MNTKRCRREGPWDITKYYLNTSPKELGKTAIILSGKLVSRT
jgi:hypothetical protein